MPKRSAEGCDHIRRHIPVTCIHYDAIDLGTENARLVSAGYRIAEPAHFHHESDGGELGASAGRQQRLGRRDLLGCPLGCWFCHAESVPKKRNSSQSAQVRWL